jgi:predicted heme/steroid binding protein
LWLLSYSPEGLYFQTQIKITTVRTLEETKKFSINELSQFDGKDGKAAYVGYKGKVYDVTESSQWTDGEHLGHMAGQNLTEEMDVAPHSEEIMERMKLVGVLA